MVRLEIESEISMLSGQQIKAVGDSMFGRWGEDELEAYWQRRERLSQLRSQLAALAAKAPNPTPTPTSTARMDAGD